MRSFQVFLFVAVASITILLSCQKEFSGDRFIPVDNGNNTPNITTAIRGRVTDENGKPVSGAEIKTTQLSVFTDINGEFKMQNVSVFDKAAYVQVVKGGYFTGSRTFVAHQGENQYIEVKLLPNTNSGVINSAAGGTVAIPGGASVTLPASAVVNKGTSAAYTGVVGVSVRWIDPTSADLSREMPGDLRGYDVNNAEVGMQTFGMLAVELKSNSGQNLQIAPGKKASLKFPLPASVASGAPATIALWSFNETNGLWKQEGTATKTGNFYEAEVSHFSFWNCDAPFPVIDFTAAVKDQNNLPIVHSQVKIRRANGSYSSAFTDSSGVVRGKIPSNESLTLELLNTCNTIVYSQSIGPYTAAANITVTANIVNSQASLVTGNVVNCSGAPLTSGSAELIINQRTYRTRITAGAFTFHISTCSASQTATLVVIDSTSNQQGASTITVNQGANNAGTSTACGVSTTQFINLTVGGTPYSIAPPDSLSGSRQSNTTLIQGNKFSTNTGGGSVSGGVNFYLAFNGLGVGSFPASYGFIDVPFPIVDSGTLRMPVTITITEYGNAGEYISGSFTGNIANNAGTLFPVQCSFRVRRRG